MCCWSPEGRLIATFAAESLDPTSVALGVLQASAVILLLVCPGYVFSVVSTRGVFDPDASEHAFLARVMPGTVLVHALELPWTISLATRVSQNGPSVYAVEIVGWLLSTCVGLPWLCGWLWARFIWSDRGTWWEQIASELGVSVRHRLTHAWTAMFASGVVDGTYVRVALRDGRRVVGMLEKQGIPSASAANHDLYLRYTVDDEGKRTKHTRGIWINGDDIVSLEFFQELQEEADES